MNLINYSVKAICFIILFIIIWLIKGYFHEILHKIKLEKHDIPCKIKFNINKKTLVKGKAFSCNFSENYFFDLNISQQKEILLNGLISNIIFLVLSITILTLANDFSITVFLIGYVVAFSFDIICNIFRRGSDAWIFRQLKKGNIKDVKKVLKEKNLSKRENYR